MSYIIKHIKWKQKELLYPDVEPILAILSDLGDDYQKSFSAEDANFLLFAQNLFNKKVLPRLFAIILVPDNGNPIRTLLNKYWMKKYKLNSGNVIDVMTTAQWKQVLADFFIESSQWIASWLHSSGFLELTNSEKNSNSSDSSLKPKGSMMTILSHLMTNQAEKSSSSALPVENIGKSKDSGTALN